MDKTLNNFFLALEPSPGLGPACWSTGAYNSREKESLNMSGLRNPETRGGSQWSLSISEQLSAPSFSLAQLMLTRQSQSRTPGRSNLWPVITSQVSSADNKIWNIHANVMTRRVRGARISNRSEQRLTIKISVPCYLTPQPVNIQIYIVNPDLKCCPCT